MAFGKTISAIGAMRRLIVLEAPVETSDEAGGREQVFAPVASLWAALEPLGGQARLAGDRLELAASHRITLRWRDDIDGAKRFRLGRRVFSLRAAADPDGRRRRLVCLVEEIGP